MIICIKHNNWVISLIWCFCLFYFIVPFFYIFGNVLLNLLAMSVVFCGLNFCNILSLFRKYFWIIFATVYHTAITIFFLYWNRYFYNFSRYIFVLNYRLFYKFWNFFLFTELNSICQPWLFFMILSSNCNCFNTLSICVQGKVYNMFCRYFTIVFRTNRITTNPTKYIFANDRSLLFFVNYLIIFKTVTFVIVR